MQKLSDLIKKYQAERNTFLQVNYNETQLRTDFLDPFFELLGWDITNSRGKATNEREVLVEEGLKASAGSNTKKPDYTFRLFAQRKFFLEAKKPSVKIHEDSEPAKQVRRYGFTAKLKISVLSNFEYLAIYDCSQKVEAGDSVTKSRIKLYHYTEYESAFEDIKEQIGQNSVYSGNFDEKWSDIEAQLKKSSVDTLFLAQINQWRLLLGQEIYLHNSTIDIEQLNDSVQSYINNIIFLRVCEDRNLETYKTLLNLAESGDFSQLITAFKQANTKYNADLFSQILADKLIANSASAFWTIIRELYFPESPYSFSVFSSDILGNIYEIFLGEKLVIENNTVILQKKAENIDRDIVTTPTFIVQEILNRTIIPFCQGKNDTEIVSASFADIACGSGVFLLETYQVLQNILIDYYLTNDKNSLRQTGLNSFKLPYAIKKQLLENCIYGVDKDYNAVQACKFGLLLKLLEDEDNNTITAPALPNLDNNIIYGNSLVQSSATNDSNRDIINPYDFDGKFDVIVGNPPYMSTEDIKKFTPDELAIYKQEFNSTYKQFDKYFLFIERGLSLLKTDGYLGYITPSKFIKVGAGKKLRELLTNNKAIEQIVSFGAEQVFVDKTTYTCLLILRNKQIDTLQYTEVNSLKEWKIRSSSNNNSYDSFTTNSLDNDGWVLYPSHLKTAYDLINKQSQPLAHIIASDNIYNGIQTSANKIYIHKVVKQDNDFLYFEKDGKQWQVEKELTRPYFQTASKEDSLDTYRPVVSNAIAIYPYLKTQNGIEFVDLQQLQTDYPYTYNYLTHYKTDLEKRDIKPTPKTADEWYRYGRHQSLDKCDVPAKIVVGVLSSGNKYGIDTHGTLISSGGTAGYCIITLPDDCQYSIYYIQALLNSKYVEWFCALIGEVFRGGYIARGTKVLQKLPIRTIDFDNQTDKQLHDTIVTIQQQLIKIQTDIDNNQGNNRKLTPLQRHFDQQQKLLDDTLKTLFNLGDADSDIPLISKIYATD